MTAQQGTLQPDRTRPKGLRAPHLLAIVAFLAVLVTVPALQLFSDLRDGHTPGFLRIFLERPERRTFAAFERSLEDESLAVRTLRPWMQAWQFILLKNGGANVLHGRHRWLFYTPGVNAMTQRLQPGESTPHDALAAVVAFRDALASRGIRLIVVPVPNKESVYPQWLSSRSQPPSRIINPDTREFLTGCKAAGVEVVDLFARYRETDRIPYYLQQDTHWSPHGIDVAASAVADVIGTRHHGQFEIRPAPVSRHGDLVRMIRSPKLESWLQPEDIPAVQVTFAKGEPSSVLVLGDSFCRIFQSDEPQDAGFVAHLARHLGRPVASLVNDGGASTLVRQELFRRPQLLAGAKVVVWEFSERDLRLGTDGWQLVPLPQATP